MPRAGCTPRTRPSPPKVRSSSRHSPIGNYPDGVGFDNVVFPWNHDEFMWSRVVDHVPDHVAWIVPYHSIREADCLHLMDDRDRGYYERWFVPFHHYDLHTKSVIVTDLSVIDRWKPLLRERLPSLRV